MKPKRPDKRVHLRCSGNVPACGAANPIHYATDPAFPFKPLVFEGVTCKACIRSRTFRHYASK